MDNVTHPLNIIKKLRIGRSLVEPIDVTNKNKSIILSLTLFISLFFLFSFINAICIVYATNNENNYSYVKEWGTLGTGSDGEQFNRPTDIAIDQSLNHIYIVDSGNNRIQVFDTEGKSLNQTWGSVGTGDGQFKNPSGVSTDPVGNVYVMDSGNHRIQKFDSSGTFITSWNVGPSVVSGAYLSDISIDVNGYVYFTRPLNNSFEIDSIDGSKIAGFGSNGLENGQFSAPTSIAVNGLNNIF